MSGSERPCPVCGTGMYQLAAHGVYWCDDCEQEYWREGNGWWRCDTSGEPENVKAVTDGGSVRIIDKTDTFHWSKDYGPDRVERAFDLGDIIVGLDPQERLGSGTLAVSQVTHGGRDITQRGLFWDSDEAFRYAESLKKGTGRRPEDRHE